jgi:hypothetical protein
MTSGQARCRIDVAADLCRHLLSEVPRTMHSIDEVCVDAKDAEFLLGPEEGRAEGDFARLRTVAIDRGASARQADA